MVDDPPCAQIGEELLWVILYSPVAEQTIIEDQDTRVAVAVADPLLSDESLHATVFHSAELLKNGLKLLAVENPEDHVALAAGVSFQNEGKGKGKAILFWWEALAIIGHIAKQCSFRVRQPEIAEEQGVTNFPGVLKSVAVIGKDSLAVAPAKVVKVLAHTLVEYDRISLLDQRRFFWPRGPTGDYNVYIGTDTWMERKDHGFLF